MSINLDSCVLQQYKEKASFLRHQEYATWSSDITSTVPMHDAQDIQIILLLAVDWWVAQNLACIYKVCECL